MADLVILCWFPFPIACRRQEKWLLHQIICCLFSISETHHQLSYELQDSGFVDFVPTMASELGLFGSYSVKVAVPEEEVRVHFPL